MPPPCRTIPCSQWVSDNFPGILQCGKDLAADWAFFEAGLAHSLVVEAESKNINTLMTRWITFGIRGLGATAGKREDDAQGLLFEF